MSRAFWELHLAVFLAGLTGIFGRLISLSSYPLVLYRMVVAWGLLYLILRLWGRRQRGSLRAELPVLVTGGFQVINLLFFFAAIKAANVSIAVICVATSSAFTALIEPLITKRRFAPVEIGLSLIALLGVALIFNFDLRYRPGIIYGLSSAFFIALYISLNRVQVKTRDPLNLICTQFAGGLLFLIALLPLERFCFPEENMVPRGFDYLNLLLLGGVCTVGMLLLQTDCMRKLSAFTVTLSLNLQPVYSIVLAMILFAEHQELAPAFYAGLALIVISVLLQTLRHRLS